MVTDWQPISTAPHCVASNSEGDNGKRPVLVTRWPITGSKPPVAIARLTREGWISGPRLKRLYFVPTHWAPLYENVPKFPPPGLTHIIHKRSSPGWAKEFDTEDAARTELLRHICGECLAGEMALVGSDEKHTFPPPDQSSIPELLGTPCGCEFQYEAK